MICITCHSNLVHINKDKDFIAIIYMHVVNYSYFTITMKALHLDAIVPYLFTVSPPSKNHALKSIF